MSYAGILIKLCRGCLVLVNEFRNNLAGVSGRTSQLLWRSLDSRIKLIN